MAKDNQKKDEIPIRFDIPTGWKAIQFGRVPTPVNQPNWKYKKSGMGKQGVGGWLMTWLFLAFSVFILLLGISESSVMGIIVGALLTIISSLSIDQGIKVLRNERSQEKKTKDNRKF